MRKKIFFSLLISALLLFFLLPVTNFEMVWDALTRIPLVFLISGFILYCVVIVFKTLRFDALINLKTNFFTLISIVSLHNFITNIVPFRLGDLSYIYLIRKAGEKSSKGLSQLAVVRVFDFIVISLIFFVSFAMLQDVPASVSQYSWIIAILLACALIIILMLVLFNEPIIILMKKVMPKKLSKITDYMEDFLSELKKMNKAHTVFKTIIYSALVWITNYVWTFIILRGLGLNFTLWEISLIFTFLVILLILPLNSFAGFGVFEGGLTGAFIAFGIGLPEAVAISFAYHIVTIIFFSAVGLFGTLRYYFLPMK